MHLQLARTISKILIQGGSVSWETQNNLSLLTTSWNSSPSTSTRIGRVTHYKAWGAGGVFVAVHGVALTEQTSISCQKGPLDLVEPGEVDYFLLCYKLGEEVVAQSEELLVHHVENLPSLI